MDEKGSLLVEAELGGSVCGAQRSLCSERFIGGLDAREGMTVN